MRSTATAFASLLSLGSAYVLYSENVETRRIEVLVQAAERTRERLENDIAVLRADRAYLARPARIEPAAKAIGLRPPVAGEQITLQELLSAGSKEPRERPR